MLSELIFGCARMVMGAIDHSSTQLELVPVDSKYPTPPLRDSGTTATRSWVTSQNNTVTT